MSKRRPDENREVSERASMAARRALEHFKSGYNCAESVLLGLKDTFNDQRLAATPVAVATSFGGGIGRTGHCCGALTGAAIGLGALFGRDQARDNEGYKRASELTNSLLQDFSERFGSTQCRELIGHDLAKDEGRRTFSEDPTRRSKCDSFVEEAARMAALSAAISLETGE